MVGRVLNDEVRINFEKRFKVSIFEGYGLTETTAYACLKSDILRANRVIGSIGKGTGPVNDMAIFNPNSFSKMKVGERRRNMYQGAQCSKMLSQSKRSK